MGRQLELYLEDEERELLQGFVKSGQAKAREFLRANILLMLDQGYSGCKIHRLFGCAETSVSRIGKKYLSQGLDQTIFDKARSGRPKKFSPEQRAKVTALACTKAPQGHSRWTLSLLKEKVIELKLVESISRSHLARVLKKTS